MKYYAMIFTRDLLSTKYIGERGWEEGVPNVNAEVTLQCMIAGDGGGGVVRGFFLYFISRVLIMTW